MEEHLLPFYYKKALEVILSKALLFRISVDREALNSISQSPFKEKALKALFYSFHGHLLLEELKNVFCR